MFDNARKRERERKLNNPNACGVGGRRWKGPGTREACAVHNARIPLERMVDFWSSLGKESRQSLLKMKEEDFIERLVYRFGPQLNLSKAYGLNLLKLPLFTFKLINKMIAPVFV